MAALGRGRVTFALLASIAAALGGAAQASATSLTPGDVVVERDGNGSGALSNAAGPVFLDEFSPGGLHVAELALPTSTNGMNKPLLDSGSATSDGLITLSGNGECVLMIGYDAPLGTEHVTESKDSDPRVIAVVKENGEINTSTALTDFANENNARSATSQECKKLYAGGNGTRTTGGVLVTEVGKSTGTQLDEDITNLRQVEVAGGQLYASADPTKAGKISIAKVGTGLPTTSKQTITNLSFESEPDEPYAYSFLTLGLGSTPDTLYVADNARSSVVKYGLSEGKWVEHGSVEVPEVTGVTANDVGGIVTIYATSAGSSGKSGTLYRFEDYTGVNGTLSGVADEIAQAPANEAWRGVAFAPGTTIGHGGTAPPEPRISTAETALPAALEDPTNATMPVTVEDPGSGYSPSELTVTASSSKESVAPVSGIKVSGTGKERTLSVTPAGVGVTKITLTVEAPDGAFTSTQISYGVSEYLGEPSDRYYSQTGSISASIPVGEGYILTASDENNVIALYKERTSGPPVKTWDFNSELPYASEEVNIHGAARAGNTVYFVGGMDNTNSGEPEPARSTMFATTISGSGASTELSYLGSYIGMRENLIEWDNENGARFGFAESAAGGVRGEANDGFKIEGVEFAPGSSTEAYLTFRSPLEPPGEGAEDRNLALVVPVTNFASLFTDGNPGTGVHPTFGTPLEWNLSSAKSKELELAGLSIRTIRENAEGEYILVASTASSADTVFQLWGWDGETEDEPVLLNESLHINGEGTWDAITSVPDPIKDGDQIEVLQDDSKVIWYGAGTKDAEKGLIGGLQKSLGALETVEIPAPGIPHPPHLSHGKNPNKGQFTLRWKPAPTLGARFTLQHQNARGGWTTVASGLTKREYTFGAGNPEEQDTWTYRVKEANETSESEYSGESEAIKVDRTPPYTPTATASRPPDYAGKGGWYKNEVTVSFSSNGDPNLPDGSPGSGVNPATLTGPKTYNTSGIYESCGTVADYAENVSEPGCLTVQVESTPPNLEITCPATALVGEAGVHATVTASDSYSGLAVDPSGEVPIPTTAAGRVTITRTAESNVGLKTTKSCTTNVEYETPGAPTLTAGANPTDTGLITLSWSGDNPLDYVGLSYTLQGHNAASDTWTTLATGIEALDYEFTGAGAQEGTWVYRVVGVDSTHEEMSEYSPASAPVVVDKTSPYAPTASPSREPDYFPGGGWYKNSVTVNFTSNGDPNLSDGSPGSGVNPASIPASQTFTTSGSHTACGTVTDYAGNVSAEGCKTVQVDATPPSLELTCPSHALQGSTISASYTASDKYSGLASPSSGSVPIETSTTGEKTVSTTAVSDVGLETTKFCTTDVESSAVTAPVLTAGSNPNNTGLFTLSWTGPSPAEYFGLTYTLQHHDASTSRWTNVAVGLESPTYEFEGGEEEKEGTWVYRVRAFDPVTHLSEYSSESEPIKVDKTPPYSPTAKATRSPDYAGGGGWYKDSVTVAFTANGDPPLADGSPGSGVNPATLSPPETFETSGSHVACGTVADYAGNVSAEGCVTVQVDATPPSLEITCPATAYVGEKDVTATVTASDGLSGLAVNPSGRVAIETARAGSLTITRKAVSNVGFETTKSCTVQILESPPELGRCVAVPGEKVGRKMVYHGWFTKPSCLVKAATQTRRYEWVSGVTDDHFTLALAPADTVRFETVGKARVICKAESGTGTLTTAKTVGDLALRFTGCSVEGAETEACTTPGRSSGELETSELEGELGIDSAKGKKQYAGLDLYPPGHTGTFVEYACGARAVTTLTGSVIAAVPTDVAFSSGPLTFAQTNGKQAPESFAGKEKDVLTNNHGEQVGLADDATVTLEEALEIDAFY